MESAARGKVRRTYVYCACKERLSQKEPNSKEEAEIFLRGAASVYETWLTALSYRNGTHVLLEWRMPLMDNN